MITWKHWSRQWAEDYKIKRGYMIDIKEGERNLHDMNENIEHIIHIDEIFELTLRELDSLIDLVGWDEQPWFKFEVVKFKNKLLKRKREFIISDLKNSVTPSRF